MSKRPYITRAKCQKVAKLLRTGGLTRGEIATKVGLSVTSVHRIARSLDTFPVPNRGPAPHWRYCSHPRTPENTSKSGMKWGTCRTCKLERDRKRLTGAGKGNGHHPNTNKKRPHYRHTLWQDLLPHSLPIASDTGRSYAMAPRRSA